MRDGKNKNGKRKEMQMELLWNHYTNDTNEMILLMFYFFFAV